MLAGGGGGVGYGGQRRGCHTGLRERPQSRLEVTFCFLLWIASMTFRRVWFTSTCLTVAASQSTLCCVFHACTAMPFFRSFLFTAPLCSLSLFSSVLPVSPMYTLSQSAQGTWYTTPFFFSAGWGCFVWTRASRRVPRDLKVVLIPRCLHTRSILSLTPLT